MRNLTVTLPEAVLDRLRILAAQRKLSVNRFVGEVLSTVADAPGKDWLAEHKALLAEIKPRPRMDSWNREEIYADRLR